MSGDVARMDKKSDKKIDADELLIVMKELGWAVPVLACTPPSLAEMRPPAASQAQMQQGRRGGDDLGGGRGL